MYTERKDVYYANGIAGLKVLIRCLHLTFIPEISISFERRS